MNLESFLREQVNLAKDIATLAHMGQTRWDKQTKYITHPEWVADHVKVFGPEYRLLLGYMT